MDALAEIEDCRGRQDGNLALAFQPEEDALLKRAAAVMAETSRLQEAHRQILMRTAEQFELMRQIGAELDPLLPHPYWDLRVVRALLAI